jgi:hypothetical protein
MQRQARAVVRIESPAEAGSQEEKPRMRKQPRPGIMHTTLELPETLQKRMVAYAMEMQNGRLCGRNRLICEAIDRYLTAQGF